MRSIFALPVGLLALSSSLAIGACDPGGAEATGAASVESMCEAWCGQQQQCYPDVFQASYTSMVECRDSCEQDAGDFYDGYQKPECVDEALAKDLCVAGLSCAQLAAVDYESCQDEFDALQQCLGYIDGGT